MTEEARRHGESLLPRDTDLENAIRRSIAFQLEKRGWWRSLAPKKQIQRIKTTRV
jgi:hypothetical protein